MRLRVQTEAIQSPATAAAPAAPALPFSRVLTVVYGLGIGGTERNAENYSRALTAAGLDVRVAVTHSPGPRFHSMEAEGIQILTPPLSGDARRCVAALGEWVPDLVHVHSHGIEPALVRALRRAFPAAVFMETNVFALPQPYARSIDISAQLGAWCEWVYRCRAGARAQHAVRLPNMVDERPFFHDGAGRVAFRAEHGVPEEALVLCRVAQPNEANWSPAIIELFSRVADELPDAWLVLVGAAPSVVAQTATLRREPRARVLLLEACARDEWLRAVYSAGDIFVHLAAGGESFGMVLAEAMLCGCVPVTLATPAFHNSQVELVGHSKGGIVCRTPLDVERVVLALCRSPERRAALAQRARARVLERYGRAASLVRMEEVVHARRRESTASLVRTCQRLLARSEGRTTGLSLLWLWLRYPLCRAAGGMLGDRLWRAGMKMIGALERRLL
jgi:hypothetical protein